MRKPRLKRRLAEALRSESHAVDESRQAARRATRLQLALEAIPHSVVVRDEGGDVVLRSRPQVGAADSIMTLELVDAAVEALVQGCDGTEPRTRTLELRGPPARELVLRAVPLCLP